MEVLQSAHSELGTASAALGAKVDKVQLWWPKGQEGSHPCTTGAGLFLGPIGEGQFSALFEHGYDSGQIPTTLSPG